MDDWLEKFLKIAPKELDRSVIPCLKRVWGDPFKTKENEKLIDAFNGIGNPNILSSEEIEKITKVVLAKEETRRIGKNYESVIDEKGKLSVGSSKG